MSLYLYSVFNSGKITCGSLPLLYQNEIHRGNTYTKQIKPSESKIGVYYIKNENIEDFKDQNSINSLLPMVLTDITADNYSDSENLNTYWAIPEKSLEQWSNFTLEQVLNRPIKNITQFETFIYTSISSFKNRFKFSVIDIAVSEKGEWYAVCDEKYYFNCKKNPNKTKDFRCLIPDGIIVDTIIVNTTFGNNPFKVIARL